MGEDGSRTCGNDSGGVGRLLCFLLKQLSLPQWMTFVGDGNLVARMSRLMVPSNDPHIRSLRSSVKREAVGVMLDGAGDEETFMTGWFEDV